MSDAANQSDANATQAGAAGNDGWQADSAFFIGQYPLTLDDKGRMLIPADVRKELDQSRDGKAFFLITGSNGQLWLYPETFYKKHVAPRMVSPVPDPDELDYSLMLFSGAARLVPDKAGRVLLPDNAVDREALGRDVILVGVREHLQLWRKDEWDEYQKRNRPRTKELAARFKNAAARH